MPTPLVIDLPRFVRRRFPDECQRRRCADRSLSQARHPDLAEEPLAAQGRAEIGMQHLDGNVTIVLEIVREIHGRHAALPTFTRDAISVRERRRVAFEYGAHAASRHTACDVAEVMAFYGVWRSQAHVAVVTLRTQPEPPCRARSASARRAPSRDSANRAEHRYESS